MPRYTDIGKLLETFDENEPMNCNDTEAEIQEQRDFEYYRGLVENAPTADVAEVVRCKDCSLSSEPKDASRYDLYCNNYDVRLYEKEQKIVCGMHFCSHGERKEK